MTGTDAPAIALSGLAKTYGARSHGTRPHRAVDGVDLSIPAGQVLALVGASGSGKTTLLKMINRLVEPDAGAVIVESEAVTDLAPAALRRRIGYVFQGVGLFPHMSVAENIAVGPSLAGWTRARIAERTGELLALVDLPADCAGRRPDQLSGGQRQRVGLARALAAGPRIMLMDEPFGALDPVTRDSLGQAYRRLHEDLGLTTVMVTHDVQEAVLLADRIVVMGAGRVLADDTPSRLLRGHADPLVEALMSTPRRQAERVGAMLAASA